MRILITGATGFIGRNLVPHIYSKFNHKKNIAILVRNSMKSTGLFEGLEYLSIIDSTKYNYKQEIKDFNPEIVIHLATLSTSSDKEEFIDSLISSNIEMGTHLLDALKGTKIKYFINIGTFAEYYYNDSELSSAYLYSATKTAFRTILKYYQQTLDFKWINVIPYTVYGAEDTKMKVIDYIISSLDVKNPVQMTKGEQRLDFIHIEDVVEFFVTLIENIHKITQNFTEFHLGTGKGTSIRELTHLIETIYLSTANIEWGGLPYRQNDILQAIAPTSKNKEFLNWESKIDLQNGIRKMNDGNKDLL